MLQEFDKALLRKKLKNLNRTVQVTLDLFALSAFNQRTNGPGTPGEAPGKLRLSTASPLP